MATEKAIKGIAFDLAEAKTARDFQRIANTCDRYAKPLLIRQRQIETTLGELQSLRVQADTGKQRSTA